jgi:hypothetical protein
LITIFDITAYSFQGFRQSLFEDASFDYKIKYIPKKKIGHFRSKPVKIGQNRSRAWLSAWWVAGGFMETGGSTGGPSV